MTQRPREATGASGTVLVVDHDQALRLLARRLLEAADYRVLDAGDGTGAERIATLYVGPIHALLVDVDMAAGDDRALVDRLRALHPGLAVVLMSPRSQRELVRRGVLGARTPFVRKPLEKSRLASRMGDALARPR